jgi:hypothetical protein
MRPPEQQNSSRDRTSLGTPARTPAATWLLLLMATVVMTIVYLAIVLIMELDEFGPRVGDIVVFHPTLQKPIIPQMTVPASATRFHGAKCSLDPNVMAEGGGSIVVEGWQGRPSLLYRVHWAGSKTALANSNCGGLADLLISRADLQKLANAAGGFGVDDKRFAQ